MDPDPELLIFFVSFFSLIFMLQLDEPLRSQEIFIIYLFSIVRFGFLLFPMDILQLLGSKLYIFLLAIAVQTAGRKG